MPPSRRQNYIRNTDRFLRSTGRVVNKGFNAFAKQNAGATDYWADSSNLVSSMQRLNFSAGSVHHYSRRIHRRRVMLEHFLACGRYPAIPIRVWAWCRDEILLRLLDAIWAYLQPILYSIFFALLTLALIILGSVLFFGLIYLMLTA